MDCDNCGHDEHDGRKPIWHSRSFWAGIALFSLSALTCIGEFPQVKDNPMYAGIVGMLFAICWIMLRANTDTGVYPTINLPGPASWKTPTDNPASQPPPTPMS